jgi:ribosomal protein L24
MPVQRGDTVTIIHGYRRGTIAKVVAIYADTNGGSSVQLNIDDQQTVLFTNMKNVTNRPLTELERLLLGVKEKDNERDETKKDKTD